MNYTLWIWLAQNSPHYADVEMNEKALSSFPDDVVPKDLLTVETKKHILSDKTNDLDQDYRETK